MDRIISEIEGQKGGPLLIYLGGVHGNEFPGIIALEKAFEEIKEKDYQFRGKALALRGNLAAIREGKRFIDKDLNRIWDMDVDHEHAGQKDSEYLERLELQVMIQELLSEGYTSAYLFDLHTTSAHTIPFIVTRDLPEFLPFIHQFDVPFITGLTGMLDGTVFELVC